MSPIVTYPRLCRSSRVVHIVSVGSSESGRMQTAQFDTGHLFVPPDVRDHCRRNVDRPTGEGEPMGRRGRRKLRRYMEASIASIRLAWP